MSDNFSASNGGTPVTFATKEAGGIHTPRNLIEVDGQDLGAAHPMPVSGPVTAAQMADLLARALVVHVDNPADLTAVLAALAGTLTVNVANLPATQEVASTQLYAALSAIAGLLQGALTVHVDNQPAATALTDAQLRASALTVHVDNQPAATALTDAQLRATAVPVVAPLPVGGAEVNRSGNVATANVAVTVMGANSGRKYFELQNLSQTDFLWFRKDGQPAVVNGIGSFALGPASSTSVGGFYSGQSTGAVSVVSVTAGHPFSAVEV